MQRPDRKSSLLSDSSVQFDLGAKPTVSEVVRHIELAADAVVEDTLAAYGQLYPGYMERTSPKRLSAFVEDCYHHLEFLASSVLNGTPDAYAQYMLWVVSVLKNRNVDTSSLGQILEIMGQGLRTRLGEGAWTLIQLPLDAAIAAAQSGSTEHQVYVLPPADAMMGAYLRAILKGNRVLAQELSLEAMQAGMPLSNLYMDVFQPALYEVGRLWETGQVSVAQEHLATAITQTVISLLFAQVELPKSRNESVIVACLDNNYHEIGARMAADMLQLAGYDAFFLGANTPDESFMEMISDMEPVAIGLSASLPHHIDPVRQAIEQVRSDFASKRPTVMVGGLSFNLTEGLWQKVGGDLWSMDARQTAQTLSGVEL